MLLFKKKFMEAIRQGAKTQTIRLWNHRRMRPGQRSYIPGIGYISILDVEQVALEQLTDADAVPDGFATAALLREELQSLYAEKIRQGFQAYRIRFAVFAPEQQQRMREERRQKKEARNKAVADAEKRASVDRTLAKLRKMADEYRR